MSKILLQLEKLPCSPEMTKVIEEMDFWDYIEENGGFSRCPRCDSRPRIIRKLEKETGKSNDSGKSNDLPWIDIHFNEDFGEIHNLHCCEYLYDFQDKKRYIRFQNLTIYKDLEDDKNYESKTKKFMLDVCKISSKKRDDIYRKIDSMSYEYIEFNSENLFVEVNLKSQVKDGGIIKYLNPRYLLKNNLKSKLFFLGI